MSSSDRRHFLTLLAVAPLAGCGFAPVYAPGGTGQALRGQVLVAAPDTRLGFQLVSRLEDRLGRGDAAAYRLNYQINTSESDLAITGTNDITRINIHGSVSFTLVETATDAQLLADTVATFTAYSTTSTAVATAAARRDAEDRLMRALADQIMSRLLASSARWS
ncbi:LPS assembly lipoprotein LptE [Nioella nitratireducens]|uniref:LPS assembly lipoprotein LptE n=1 Tax=Nioella nitratireducens TaxID=1287720 RepID=UPI0008FD62C5|nr:LPS assembly lipoprotein LptE [Nioella nitratireducens]